MIAMQDSTCLLQSEAHAHIMMDLLQRQTPTSGTTPNTLIELCERSLHKGNALLKLVLALSTRVSSHVELVHRLLAVVEGVPPSMMKRVTVSKLQQCIASLAG